MGRELGKEQPEGGLCSTLSELGKKKVLRERERESFYKGLIENMAPKCSLFNVFWAVTFDFHHREV